MLNTLLFLIAPSSFIRGKRGKKMLNRWSKKVYAKDRFTCQKCMQQTNENLHAHHIEPKGVYPRLSFKLDNGISLCGDCHRQFHREYGIKKGGGKELREWLNI